jgi:hypothetical protein
MTTTTSKPILGSDADSTQLNQQSTAANVSRRNFLGRAGAAIALGATAAPTIAAAETASAHGKPAGAGYGPYGSGSLPDQLRVQHAFDIRVAAALANSLIPIPPHATNGDEQAYPDGSATYTKAVKQDAIGLVNPAAYHSFRKALKTGDPNDFAAIIVGGTRTLNGPQGAFAYTLEGSDSRQFGSAPNPGYQENVPIVPAPPAFASPAWGTELTELYWCSLLRDVAFTDYHSSPVAAAACAELTSMPAYNGPRDATGKVTPSLLFRGYYPGETLGPYISQLIITPTMFGAAPLPNTFITYQPGINYMLDPATFFDVQTGIDTGLSDQPDPTPRTLHNGRGLAAWTHVDVLFQAYFTAFLVMNTLGVPLNPGNPYVGSTNQNGFDTFGGPDMAATIGEVAARTLDNVWYQKWVVHLRPRPESSGGIAYLQKTGQGGTVQAHLHPNFLNSQALRASFHEFNSYFLAQCFPEGSPSHPAYPTGHGTVAGACITILKFFFDGNYVIPNPVVPSPDGLSLVPYTGPDAGQLTINGELHKLAHNITFGHGIHGGIHWRSDSDISIRLGEAFGLSFLQDKIRTYNEKFTINLTKLDGTIATLSNR